MVIFPYGKVSDRVLRRLTGIKDLEYERSYCCYGTVFTNEADNSETLVLQMTKEGKVYFSCAGHELFHLVTNLFARIHQKIDAGEGGDEVAAQTMGTLSNRLYLLMNRYGIRFTEG